MHVKTRPDCPCHFYVYCSFKCRRVIHIISNIKHGFISRARLFSAEVHCHKVWHAAVTMCSVSLQYWHVGDVSQQISAFWREQNVHHEYTVWSSAWVHFAFKRIACNISHDPLQFSEDITDTGISPEYFWFSISPTEYNAGALSFNRSMFTARCLCKRGIWSKLMSSRLFVSRFRQKREAEMGRDRVVVAGPVWGVIGVDV